MGPGSRLSTTYAGKFRVPNIQRSVCQKWGGRLQVAMEDTWHMEKGEGRTSGELKKGEAGTQSLCRGPFP